MQVTVYSTPSCIQCKQTYRELEKRGIEFKIVDLASDEQAMAHVKNLGFTQAPIVETETEAWAGFQPEKIRQLAA
jgi:glutaredoxin-like protein NrdH